MQVAKWGNSLAVRLPASVVEALELRVGGEIEIHLGDARQFGMTRMLRGLLTVHPPTLDVHATGLALAGRYGFSFYDAMIAAAAVRAGCDTLCSEDMQHGMTLDGGLQIIDPFRAERSHGSAA